MVKWTGKGKDSPSVERQRRRMVREAGEHQKHRQYLRALKDKLDLYGEDSLNQEEKEIVRLSHDYFFPEEG